MNDLNRDMNITWLEKIQIKFSNPNLPDIHLFQISVFICNPNYENPESIFVTFSYLLETKVAA